MEDVRSGLVGVAIVFAVALFALTMLKHAGIEADALSNSYFVTISDEENGDIVYYTKTGVMYWRSDSAYNRGTLTMLCDADGKPVIYEGK